MFNDFILIDVLLHGILLVFIGLSYMVIDVRVIGLRTFSKMASFVEFATTVAVGSLLAGCVQATEWSTLAQH